jgi:hypothetical protein
MTGILQSSPKNQNFDLIFYASFSPRIILLMRLRVLGGSISGLINE